MTHSRDRFAACADIVTKARGAFVPHDLLVGGPSAYGIGLGLLSVWQGGPADVAALRALSRAEAARILHHMVWQPVGAGRLPPGPDLALFAYALEAGTIRAMADLQAELGVAPSGAWDTATIAAAAARPPAALARAIAARHAAWREKRAPAVPAMPPVPGIRQRARVRG
jgi:lysozyme family protein